MDVPEARLFWNPAMKLLCQPADMYIETLATEGRVVGNCVVLDMLYAEAIADPRIERIWENEEFSLNIYEASAAADVENSENWGVSSLGLDASLFHSRGCTGAGVRIGIADTGLDLSHPTFQKLRTEERLVAFAEFDKFGEKVVQLDSAGQPLPDGEAVPTWGDFHGTHCAAILVGADTDGFARGMAPDAELVVARFQVGSLLGFKACFDWLAKQNCDVVSLSLGRAGKTEAWAPEIARLLSDGVAVVAASGNEFLDINNPTRSPGNYPLAGLVSVGAIDKGGNVWFKSGGEIVNWPDTVQAGNGTSVPSFFSGTNHLLVPTVVGPGVDVVSAQPANGYYSVSGTSMATPHIAGLVSLILSRLRAVAPSATARNAVELLLDHLVDEGAPGDDIRYGRGRVHVQALAASIFDG